MRETLLTPADLIYPLFVHDEEEDEFIESMPGCRCWSISGLVEEAKEAHALGIQAVVLFPRIAENLKTPNAAEAWNPDGLVPRAIRALKEALPHLCVVTDVALDPYNSDGHDGLVEGYTVSKPRQLTDQMETLKILNDETVEALTRQALCHASAGADVISPSDMMDGRVQAIRLALDQAGFEDVSILSYAVKYASAFYGPFRGALDSAPKAGSKATYQMDPSNVREALLETRLDEEEGADMLMVKPAGYYLDVIAKVRDITELPVAAYQVSGEYLMLEGAIVSGWMDRRRAVLESLVCIKRAGADIILTYYAKAAAEWLR